MVIVPDEVRLRQARELLRGVRAPAFLALERHGAAASVGDTIWRSLSLGGGISLAEAVGRANPGGGMATEPPLVRVSIPRDFDPRELDGNAAVEGVSGHLLPVLLRPAEKRALDLLADGPGSPGQTWPGSWT